MLLQLSTASDSADIVCSTKFTYLLTPCLLKESAPVIVSCAHGQITVLLMLVAVVFL